MTSYNKLNSTQKGIMAKFMASHPSLAKNDLPNSAQGRATSIMLWDELSEQLNAVGPPVKDAKMWRKVFADQKYQAKKKLHFNKSSNKWTGQGPHSHKVITAAEKLFIKAAGLDACVEESIGAPEFVSVPTTTEAQMSVSDSYSTDEETSSSHSSLPGPSTATYIPTRKKLSQRKNGSGLKLALLQQNLNSVSDFQKNLDAKLERLIETQEKLLMVHERILMIKEEKHRMRQAMQEIDLEIIKNEPI